jgi:hypothetical protein
MALAKLGQAASRVALPHLGMTCQRAEASTSQQNSTALSIGVFAVLI